MKNDSSRHASNPSSDAPGKSQGGGIFIALGAIVGVFAGGYLGQPSAGLLAGLAVGTGAALIVWLKGR